MSPFHRSFFFSSSSLFASSTSSLRLSLAFDSISHFLALIVSPSSSVHNDYSATTVASKPVVFPSLLVVVAAYFSAHAGSLTRQPLVPRDIYQHPRWRHNLAGFSSKVDESSNAASPFFLPINTFIGLVSLTPPWLLALLIPFHRSFSFHSTIPSFLPSCSVVSDRSFGPFEFPPLAILLRDRS